VTTEAIERSHVRAITRIWTIAQSIIDRGLAPLWLVWPQRGDVLPHPGEVVSLAAADPPRGYSPLAPAGRVPRIWALSDAQLRQLWPQIPPADVREYAPWATTYREVRRLVADQSLSATDLQSLVRRAIGLERAARPRDVPELRLVASTRQRGAFRLRYSPEAMAIFGPDGPIPPPPVPPTITADVIDRQIDWIRLALGQQVRAATITPAVTGAMTAIEGVSHAILDRVLPIDLPRDVPEIQTERLLWYQQHVDLIEAGVRGPSEPDSLRSRSLLEDVADHIRAAHEQGLRVEDIAGGIRERYGVSTKRAELIARDQVLKLNGRLARARQQSTGITEYTWVSSRDKRVRKTHADLHGTRQSWANPPPVGGARHEHPGGDYQCRCIAKPVLPAWLV
jgi:SPP1 gp7 family putative phage head morphogenesis protein